MACCALSTLEPLGASAWFHPGDGRVGAPFSFRCRWTGYSPVSSSTVAAFAFSLTDSIPFFADALLV